jgi:hypothetical protein
MAAGGLRIPINRGDVVVVSGGRAAMFPRSGCLVQGEVVWRENRLVGALLEFYKSPLAFGAALVLNAIK